MRKWAKSWESVRKCAKCWESMLKVKKVWESVLNAGWEMLAVVKNNCLVCTLSAECC